MCGASLPCPPHHHHVSGDVALNAFLTMVHTFVSDRDPSHGMARFGVVFAGVCWMSTHVVPLGWSCTPCLFSPESRSFCKDINNASRPAGVGFTPHIRHVTCNSITPLGVSFALAVLTRQRQELPTTHTDLVVNDLFCRVITCFAYHEVVVVDLLRCPEIGNRLFMCCRRGAQRKHDIGRVCFPCQGLRH